MENNGPLRGPTKVVHVQKDLYMYGWPKIHVLYSTCILNLRIPSSAVIIEHFCCPKLNNDYTVGQSSKASDARTQFTRRKTVPGRVVVAMFPKLASRDGNKRAVKHGFIYVVLSHQIWKATFTQ